MKLKLQYFVHLMGKTDSLENTLMLGKIEGRRRRGPQRMRWLNGITNSMDMSLSKLRRWWRTGSLACCSSWGHKESDMTEQLNWTVLSYITFIILSSVPAAQRTFWSFYCKWILNFIEKFFPLSNISLYRYITISVFMHLLKDFLVASSFDNC